MSTSQFAGEPNALPFLAAVVERQLAPNTTTTFPPSFYTESRADWVTVPASVFTAICPLLVAVRFWARRRTSGQVASDDWTCLASLVRVTQRMQRYEGQVCQLPFLAKHYGTSRHMCLPLPC